MRVGIAGLGKMGMAFAERLLGAGHDIAVWNRSPDKAKALASRGAAFAATPAELVGLCDLVLVIVSDDAAVIDVFEGKDGLLSADCKGKLLVDMSTVRPATHEALGKKVEAAGGRFVECPIGGSVKVASEGKLLGFAGGDAADVERAKQVVKDLCRRVDHTGPIGSAAALKLAINLPLLVYWQALGEAVSLLDGYGFDADWLVEMFSESSGGTNTLKVRGVNVAKALKGEEVPLTVDLPTMRKDLGLMLDAAKAKGRESPLVEQVYGRLGTAIEAGMTALDCTGYPAYWARHGGKAE